MDKQEAFDKMVRGLSAQGWQRSVREGHGGQRCVYRASASLKCAVGHLLEKEEALLGDAEDLSPSELFPQSSDLFHAFLAVCQKAHDASNGGYYMACNFLRAARIYNLTWPSDIPAPTEI